MPGKALRIHLIIRQNNQAVGDDGRIRRTVQSLIGPKIPLPHLLSVQTQGSHEKLPRVGPDDNQAVLIHTGRGGSKVVVSMQVVLPQRVVAPPENPAALRVDAENAALPLADIVTHEKEPLTPEHW